MIDDQQLWEQQEHNHNESCQKCSGKKDSRADLQHDSDDDRDFDCNGHKKQTWRNNNYD